MKPITPAISTKLEGTRRENCWPRQSALIDGAPEPVFHLPIVPATSSRCQMSLESGALRRAGRHSPGRTSLPNIPQKTTMPHSNSISSTRRRLSENRKKSQVPWAIPKGRGTMGYAGSQVRRKATGGGLLIEPTVTVRAVLSAKPIQNAAVRSIDVSSSSRVLKGCRLFRPPFRGQSPGPCPIRVRAGEYRGRKWSQTCRRDGPRL
jgi:hypothetical protein